MFEHFLDQHAPDRRRRLRLTVAAHLAALATAGAIGFVWLIGKLHIAQVAAPNSSYVLVQMALDTPLPPPPLPPAPARAESEHRPEPEEPLDEQVPEEVVELRPPPKPRAGSVGDGPPTATGTSPFGVPGVGVGVPGVNHFSPGFTSTTVATVKPPKLEQRAPVPLSAVRAQAVYTPSPDQARLAATRAGMFDKRPGANETAFCVDATGRTVEIRTIRPFPGDPGVDAVIRATIKTWRFRPFMVAGKATKTCTAQVFRINFR